MRDPNEVFERVKKKVTGRERRRKIARIALGVTVASVEIVILVIGVKLLLATTKDASNATAKEYDENVTVNLPRPKTKYTDEQMAEMYFPEDYIGYRYPVLPLMSTWPYGNHGDMLRVCRIPEDILATMSTEELLQSVLVYPLWSDAMVYSSMEQGHEMLRRNFNGLAELCEREDRCQCLLKLIDEHPDWFELKPYPYPVHSEELHPVARPGNVVDDLVRYHGFDEVKEEVYRKLRYDPTPIDMRDVDPDTFSK